jgi:endonuclease/exonuclease/phosphatase family metal-dependent hydrolase
MRNPVSAFLLTAALLAGITFIPADLARADENREASMLAFTTYNAPPLLTYEELTAIDGPEGPPAALRAKLDALLSVPFVSNEAYASVGAPELSRNEKLGSFIRVGFWNIERGWRLDDIRLALEDPEQFMRKVKAEPDSATYKEVLDELNALRSVDVLALNEADLGLKRTRYRDVTRELAAALKMNYTYGVEFIEIDPLNLGTEQFSESASDEQRVGLRKLIEVDRERYKGLQGTAILSRFPIRQVRLVPLKHQPYDWYGREKKKVSVAESLRRRIGRAAFLQDVSREIRYGGRSVLIAELDVPQLQEGALTVVATHLEDRCDPSGRRRQAQEVLSIIKDIRGPVVLAGDLNTSGMNNSPTSIHKEIFRRVSSKGFWAKRAVKMLTSFGFAFDFALASASYMNTLQDPTAKGLFFISPNKEALLFKDFERVRFSDGCAFDFRGDARRTINGTAGTLANSNQRSTTKGFIPTRSAERTYWSVGKNKLDWIFVKAYAKAPRGAGEPYRMAPHFARTLEKFNHSIGHRLSDHSPITVDLPVEEPRM